MLQENHLKTKKILVLGTELVSFYFLFILKRDIPCVFNTYLHIRCPECGMTRAFRMILSFNLIEAFKYNILSIPLFVFLIFLNLYIILDIYKEKGRVQKYLKTISKFYIPILIFVVLSIFVNNFHFFD